MFRKEKNEQNENILYLSSILNYHIMFTIFKFRIYVFWKYKEKRYCER